jgi:peroxiredoxin
MRIFIAALIAFLGLAVTAWAGAGHNDRVGRAGHGGLQPFVLQKEKKDAKAQNFVLKDLSGREVSLERDYAGKVVLLHFWASWCDACEKEFPAIERLANRFESKGLGVLTIAGDSTSRAKAYAREHNLKLPVAVDTYGKAMRLFRVSVMPTSIVMDRDGRILGRLVGGRDYDDPEAIKFFTDLLEGT